MYNRTQSRGSRFSDRKDGRNSRSSSNYRASQRTNRQDQQGSQNTNFRSQDDFLGTRPPREGNGNRYSNNSERSSKNEVFGYKPFAKSYSSSGGGHSYGSGGRSRFSNSRSFGGGNRSYGNRGGGRFSRSSSRLNKSIDVKMFVNKIVTKEPEDKYIPEHTFSDFDISDQIKQNLEFKKFTYPTPIQDKAIQPILDGKDVLGIANTGTGKTAAFLIPLIDKVVKNPNEKVMIIVPTRELAMQVRQDLMTIAYGMRIYSVLMIGGESLRKQMFDYNKLTSFVIGTPGRLKDMINREVVKTSMFTNLVLDEVDRMLDMGFIEDIRFIIENMPKERQSMFFSATITREIENLINQTLSTPEKIELKSRPTSENVHQDIVTYPTRENKIEILHDLLIKPEMKKVLIFVKTKIQADKLDRELYDRGFKIRSIHGDKNQSRRKRALEDFKFNKVNILVATDVAARGLDLKDITHVINYDTPENYDDYIHRIGRTGRADKTGVALTFVEERLAREVVGAR